MKHRHKRCGGDDGVALVEFALVAPVLFLVIFGIIEFGWAFLQDLDVRHGAREGARLIAVNYNPVNRANDVAGNALQTQDIVDEICERMDSGSDVEVRLEQLGTKATGQAARVTIQAPLDQLTGFLDFALSGIDLRSRVQIRLEQDAWWADSSTVAGNVGGFLPCP